MSNLNDFWLARRISGPSSFSSRSLSVVATNVLVENNNMVREPLSSSSTRRSTTSSTSERTSLLGQRSQQRDEVVDQSSSSSRSNDDLGIFGFKKSGRISKNMLVVALPAALVVVLVVAGTWADRFNVRDETAPAQSQRAASMPVDAATTSASFSSIDDALVEMWDAAKLQSLRTFLSSSEHANVRFNDRDVQNLRLASVSLSTNDAGGTTSTPPAWWDERTTEEQKWWNETADKMSAIAARDAGITAKTSANVWNRTVATVETDGAATAATSSALWNNTVSTLAADEAATVQAGATVWNATGAAVRKDEVAVAAVSDEIWNATLHQLANDDAKIAQWWVATERAVGSTATSDAKSIESAAKTAWQATEAVAAHEASTAKVTAQQDLSSAGAAERAWWNATNSWLAAHLVRAVGDDDRKDVTVTYLNHSYAYSLLSDRDGNYYDYSHDYFAVRPDAQINQAYCGVASAVAVLNSLHVGNDPIYAPYSYTTQSNLLANCASSAGVIVNDTHNGILLPPFGLTLDMVAALLECQSSRITATVKRIDPNAGSSLTDMLHDFATALLDDQQRIIVNYHRAAVGQVGGGHFSPVVSRFADHDGETSFLISDVAKYKYPPSWIVAKHLYERMATLDPCGGHYNHKEAASIRDVPSSQHFFDKVMTKLQCQPAYRGYIVIEKRT